MNEVTRIHLGRQPFTIAIDAHKQLRQYLDAIKEAVGKSHKEVIEEVELRMAELLMERGITADRAILVDDVAYLKKQLGEPGDFKGDETDGADEEAGPVKDGQKRLYRDEKNGMIAGVASGLATYFNIDAVIVRLIFILLTIAWGWGILLYIILWIVVPAARTTSDRLQMRGKAVTIDNLAETVNREVTAAANRAGRAGQATGSLVGSIAKISLGIIGVIICTAATFALFGLAVAAGYVVTQGHGLIEDVVSFPVGAKETTLVVAGFICAGIIALWMFLIGSAMTKRKWTLPGWVTASIWGIFLTAAAAAAIAAPDAVSSVRQRYENAHRSSTRQVMPFTALDIQGQMTFRYVESDQYKIDVRYLGKAQSDTLTTKVNNSTLFIDATQFNAKSECTGFCIDTDAVPEVTIYAPEIIQAELGNYGTVHSIHEGDVFRNQ
jgi:phage shock protein PspC (stress-responsive transcriptional regulator)